MGRRSQTAQPFRLATTSTTSSKAQHSRKTKQWIKKKVRRELKVAQINLDGFKNACMKITLPRAGLGRTLRGCILRRTSG
jgi:hypothetical protein